MAQPESDAFANDGAAACVAGCCAGAPAVARRWASSSSISFGLLPSTGRPSAASSSWSSCFLLAVSCVLVTRWLSGEPPVPAAAAVRILTRLCRLTGADADAEKGGALDVASEPQSHADEGSPALLRRQQVGRGCCNNMASAARPTQLRVRMAEKESERAQFARLGRMLGSGCVLVAEPQKVHK